MSKEASTAERQPSPGPTPSIVSTGPSLITGDADVSSDTSYHSVHGDDESSREKQELAQLLLNVSTNVSLSNVRKVSGMSATAEADPPPETDDVPSAAVAPVTINEEVITESAEQQAKKRSLESLRKKKELAQLLMSVSTTVLPSDLSKYDCQAVQMHRPPTERINGVHYLRKVIQPVVNSVHDELFHIPIRVEPVDKTIYRTHEMMKAIEGMVGSKYFQIVQRCFTRGGIDNQYVADRTYKCGHNIDRISPLIAEGIKLSTLPPAVDHIGVRMDPKTQDEMRDVVHDQLNDSLVNENVENRPHLGQDEVPKKRKWQRQIQVSYKVDKSDPFIECSFSFCPCNNIPVPGGGHKMCKMDINANAWNEFVDMVEGRNIPDPDQPPPVPASSSSRTYFGCMCPGCLAPECGICKFCKDKFKFGGRDVLHHKCINRRCHVTSNGVPTKDNMECINVEGCNCIICTDSPRPVVDNRPCPWICSCHFPNGIAQKEIVLTNRDIELLVGKFNKERNEERKNVRIGIENLQRIFTDDQISMMMSNIKISKYSDQLMIKALELSNLLTRKMYDKVIHLLGIPFPSAASAWSVYKQYRKRFGKEPCPEWLQDSLPRKKGRPKKKRPQNDGHKDAETIVNGAKDEEDNQIKEDGNKSEVAVPKMDLLSKAVDSIATHCMDSSEPGTSRGGQPQDGQVSKTTIEVVVDTDSEADSCDEEVEEGVKLKAPSLVPSNLNYPWPPKGINLDGHIKCMDPVEPGALEMALMKYGAVYEQRLEERGKMFPLPLSKIKRMDLFKDFQRQLKEKLSSKNTGDRCRKCPGCKVPDCGNCRTCKDKPKFGGPDKLRKSCLNRRCDVSSAINAGNQAGPDDPYIHVTNKSGGIKKKATPKMASVAPSSSDFDMSASKPKMIKTFKHWGCRKCPGCKVPDCGSCRTCKDKTKFGGPGKIRKRCLNRRCDLRMATPGTQVQATPGTKVKATTKKGEGQEKVLKPSTIQKWGCRKCPGCLTPDCGNCIPCKDKPKFGGPNIRRMRCVNRRCELRKVMPRIYKERIDKGKEIECPKCLKKKKMGRPRKVRVEDGDEQEQEKIEESINSPPNKRRVLDLDLLRTIERPKRKYNQNKEEEVVDSTSPKEKRPRGRPKRKKMDENDGDKDAEIIIDGAEDDQTSKSVDSEPRTSKDGQ